MSGWVCWVFALVMLAMFVVTVRAVRGLRRLQAYRRGERAEDQGIRRCACGYRLVGLAVPRCPECGRAIGFDASFEEMGITPEELAEAAKRKAWEQRQRAKREAEEQDESEG